MERPLLGRIRLVPLLLGRDDLDRQRMVRTIMDRPVLGRRDVDGVRLGQHQLDRRDLGRIHLVRSLVGWAIVGRQRLVLTRMWAFTTLGVGPPQTATTASDKRRDLDLRT